MIRTALRGENVAKLHYLSVRFAFSVEEARRSCNFQSGDRFQYLHLQFQGKTAHEILKRKNNATLVPLPDHDTFESDKRTRADSDSLPDIQNWVRLDPMLLQSRLQSLNGRIRKRSRFAPGSQHERDRPGYIQYLTALASTNAHKHVPGK